MIYEKQLVSEGIKMMQRDADTYYVSLFYNMG
jgi:hypothetical protein